MKRFGTVTPSSNVVVEQVTQAILRDFPEISAHFSRISFAGTADPFPDDYDWQGMTEAARLLGPAKLDAVCWNGSKGGSVGFEKDREICRRFREVAGAPATTSTLVLDETLRRDGARKVAFVTPYRDDFIDKVKRVWEAEGYSCVAGLGAGLSDNYSYSTLDAGRIRDMTRKAVAAKPDAVIFYCTNMVGAPLVDELEQELGLPIYDSVSVAVCQCLWLLGVETARGGKWGSLFRRG